jgi:murein DD-endopeptidase MepM/ murein hydrolase activator NlpD
MEDRRITYAVSNFFSANDGDTNQDSSDPSLTSAEPAHGDATGSAPRPETADAPVDAVGQNAAAAPADRSDAPAIEAHGETGTKAAEPPAEGTAPDLPVMALPADDPETHIDEARLRSALALSKLPISPRQFYTRQRANIVSLLGIIVAIGAVGWYVGTHDRPGEPKLVEVRDQRPAKHAGFISPKPLAPALYSVPLPKIDHKVLMSLGNLEYKIGGRRFVRYVQIQKGDTFSQVLNKVGVPIDEARSAIGAMRTIFDPRKLRPGLKVAVSFGTVGEEQGQFLGVSFDSAFDKTVQVQRQPNGEFASAEIKKDLDVGYARSNGVIKASLFQDARNANAPTSAIVGMIHLFSFAVDFQRDIRQGDKFELLYRVRRDHQGKIVKTDEVAYASLTTHGTVHRLYRFQPTKNGPVTYLNGKGEGNRRALMKTPIDGARITSTFGLRRHPILGYTRMHTGVDFGAPRGTPIFAAGDGTVIMAGWHGGYGNYVRIRHNKDYTTGYGHMSKILVKVGQRVKQGQKIGLVGTTGMSTGPHLHYEVLRDGHFINPVTMKLPSFKRLRGTELARFMAHKKKLDAIYAALGKSGNTGRLLTVKATPESGCKNGIRLDPTDTRPCR